jgi:hypothetical protein
MSFGHAAAVMERQTVRGLLWRAEDAGREDEALRLRRRLEGLEPFRWAGPGGMAIIDSASRAAETGHTDCAAGIDQ